MSPLILNAFSTEPFTFTYIIKVYLFLNFFFFLFSFFKLQFFQIANSFQRKKKKNYIKREHKIFMVKFIMLKTYDVK